jgi:hypothetical protein
MLKRYCGRQETNHPVVTGPRYFLKMCSGFFDKKYSGLRTSNLGLEQCSQ